MSVAGAITTIEAIRDWWDMIGRSHGSEFIVYHGIVRKGTRNAEAYKNNDPEISREDAWVMVEKYFQMQKGGQYTLFVKQQGSPNWGVRQFIDLGSVRTAGIAGVNGYNSIGEYVAKEMEIYDLRRRVEDMEAARNEKQNFLEKIFDPDTVRQIAVALAPAIAQKIAGVNPAVAGMVSQIAGNHSADMDEMTAQNHSVAGESDIQDINNNIQVIASNVDNPADFFATLAKITKESPEMVKAVLNNLKNSDNEL